MTQLTSNEKTPQEWARGIWSGVSSWSALSAQWPLEERAALGLAVCQCLAQKTLQEKSPSMWAASVKSMGEPWSSSLLPSWILLQEARRAVDDPNPSMEARSIEYKALELLCSMGASGQIALAQMNKTLQTSEDLTLLKAALCRDLMIDLEWDASLQGIRSFKRGVQDGLCMTPLMAAPGPIEPSAMRASEEILLDTARLMYSNDGRDSVQDPVKAPPKKHTL